MSGPRETSKGKPKSPEHRRKLSEARLGKKTRPHSEETILKMKKAWERRRADKQAYAEYCQKISERMSTPEKLMEIRDRFAKLIRDGNHNGKSSNTSLERRFAKYLGAIEFEQQFILSTHKGSFTFDFYLPDRHMLVEVDGEYWHRKSAEQVNRDKLKERLSKEMGYRFLRISDLDWRPQLIDSTDDEIDIHNASIIAIREQYLVNNN